MEQETPTPRMTPEEQALWDEILPEERSLEELLISYPVPAVVLMDAWGLTQSARDTVPERLKLLRNVLDKSSILGRPVIDTLRTVLDLEDSALRQSTRWHAAMDVEARKKSRKNFKRGVVSGRYL